MAIASRGDCRMFNALATFMAVASEGSFSKVARRNRVAVSSVTRRITSLESELGVKLLRRSSRKVMLTDAGEQFLPRARTLLAELSEAKERLNALDTAPRGLLTVTAPSAFGRRFVAPAVIEFLNRYPSLQLDLHVSDEVVD